MTTYAAPPPPPPTRDPPRRGGDGPAPPPRRPDLKDPRWAKLAIIFGALVMVVSGLVVAVPKIVSHWALGNVTQTDVIPPELKGQDISGPINFLLLGMDERTSGVMATEPVRADSIVLVHIPAAHDRVFMVSIPRDTRVEIPAFPDSGFSGGTDKINAAFAFG